MITSLKTPLFVTLILPILGIVGILFAIVTWWLPQMSSNRTTIRQNEAAIAEIQRQQDNVSELNRQLAERLSEKERLEAELWPFSQEDAFFDSWEAYGLPNQTTVTLQSVADAAPGPTPVQREAALTITGSLTNVLRTIQALATKTPAVVLRDARFTPNNVTTGTVIAEITVTTLWYDDTLR